MFNTGIKQLQPAYLLVTICLILVIPAFFLNLGLMPLLADEATRALVSQEMMISGNYIVPTINGEFYYKKPPFYNWILIAVFNLTGKVNELSIRLPSVIPLLLFGITIFLFTRPYTGQKTALAAALFFLTCGRMLIYSSMLGHIDIFYSWITFVSFIVIFECFRKERYVLLFTLSYLLAAIGFLCKGLPSVFFQGLTLSAFFIIEKKWEKLFSFSHVAGLLVFTLILGWYFYLYNSHHPIVNYFETLWTESSQRTVMEKSWFDSVQHVLVFPFTAAYHILPWSFLLIFAIRKNFFSILKENRFLRFCFVTFCANIFIYWLSPGTLPRYLFMLYPFLFIFAMEFYQRYHDTDKIRNGITNILFGIFASILTLSFLAPLFLEQTAFIDLVIAKSLILFGIACVFLIAFFKFPGERILCLIAILLLARIGFDLFVLPVRYHDSQESKLKQMAMEVGKITGQDTVEILPGTPVNHDISFYITRERGKILPRNTGHVNDTDFYIAAQHLIESKPHELYYTFETRYRNTPLYLVKYKQ